MLYLVAFKKVKHSIQRFCLVISHSIVLSIKFFAFPSASISLSIFFCTTKEFDMQHRSFVLKISYKNRILSDLAAICVQFSELRGTTKNVGEGKRGMVVYV